MSELDKTIEELEAEVLSELEEASEKPLDDGTSGSKKDLGLGSNNADEGVAKASDPAPNVAGADKAESVPGERKTLVDRNTVQIMVMLLLVKLPVEAP